MTSLRYMFVTSLQYDCDVTGASETGIFEIGHTIFYMF